LRNHDETLKEPLNVRYVFGDCVLDGGTRQLLRAGQPIPLGPRAFELLELLLRSRPQAVSRTRLTAALWPETHVGPTSLHVLVSQVRAAVQDDAANPRWIRTVSRFGYAFAGPASEAPSSAGEPPRPSPDLDGGPRLLFEGDEVPLDEGDNVVGREPGVAVRINTPGVSRRHARIVVRGREATIEDLGSKNGTFVGTERVASPRILAHGDVVHLGQKVRCVFSCRPPSETETEAP
jgi:DNA-binding winged helix-turn-helix (wHTH) protein